MMGSFSTLACLLALSAAALSINGGYGLETQSPLANPSQNITEEMHLITKSLDDLLGELTAIKQEANGRLSSVKNRLSTSTSNPEQIRQVKVSRFVLRRVAELESESHSMREELNKLFNLRFKQTNQQRTSDAQPKQEDSDFDDQPASSTTTSTTTTNQKKPDGMPETSSTTLKPSDQEEAAKIGFDVEALKKLGDELYSDLEARQQQPVESLRGVHEQVIRLVDNMVQNYLGNVRRAIHRMSTFIDNRRASLTSNNQPRGAPTDISEMTDYESFVATRQSILTTVEALSKKMREFPMQWARAVGKQQSPLIDRIPPRGVELWRDFWDTVRKQVRVINEEFRRVSRDMSRLVTSRLPIGSSTSVSPNLLYSASQNAPVEQQVKRFQEFYDKMSATLGEEQLKMDSALNKASQTESSSKLDQGSNLIDEQDDQSTKDELTRNVALRLQIQQEISVFGSIFDIMRAFIQRLRESATNVVRDVIQPGASNNNNNNAVTPGPSVKPQVDKLLDETIDSQRNINSQSKPVLLPNNRPSSG